MAVVAVHMLQQFRCIKRRLMLAAVAGFRQIQAVIGLADQGMLWLDVLFEIGPCITHSVFRANVILQTVAF